MSLPFCGSLFLLIISLCCVSHFPSSLRAFLVFSSHLPSLWNTRKILTTVLPHHSSKLDYVHGPTEWESLHIDALEKYEYTNNWTALHWSLWLQITWLNKVYTFRFVEARWRRSRGFDSHWRTSQTRSGPFPLTVWLTTPRALTRQNYLQCNFYTFDVSTCSYIALVGNVADWTRNKFCMGEWYLTGVPKSPMLYVINHSGCENPLKIILWLTTQTLLLQICEQIDEQKCFIKKAVCL